MVFRRRIGICQGDTMPSLPRVEILRCFFDESVEPHLSAMLLRWDIEFPGLADSVWRLPENVTLEGAPPSRFGITIERQGKNSFRVRVLWNQLSLIWDRLSRNQIINSSLAPILKALGTDLWYLLEQPVPEALAA
jgi:hypothetical protein